ncbi:type II toxin-antitoxin system YoeB family toxin [Pseudomonas sp. HR96]
MFVQRFQSEQSDEHRLIYTIENGALQIVQCRYHY